ncbi:MAG: hypothetical protein GYA35_01385, partial [Thermoanaerobaculaceae bacterium]|nr:hypothetical protein [Thermoanaerobaculaceae bacterium]
MRKNMVFLFLPIFLVFSEFCFSQTPPPNSPVITEVSKDRLAVDDLLVIKGLNFKPQGDSQTFVLFEGLPPILVQPESDSKISVVVPQGAKSGAVKVKTSTFLEGTLYELESNEIKILVMWGEYDLRPIIDFFNNYFGYGNYNRNFSVVGIMTAGSNDDVFLRVNGGTVGYTIETFVHLKSDGTWDWQFLGNFWPSQSYIWDEAVDPITKSPALLLMSANYITINASGFPVSSFPNSIYAWRPYDLYYDNDGNLYVLGNYIGQLYDTSDDLCCVWKFSRGEQIILNPNNSNSLIPGGISGDLDNFAVGGNGGIAAEMWQGQNYSFLIISNGSAPQIVAPPISSLYYCDGYWNFAIDCRGTIYATNDEYGYDEWDCGPPIIYTIPDNQQLFTIPNDICGYHFPAVDGYGNIYI